MNPYDNPGNIRVDMQQEGLATPKAIFPTGEVAPAFEHPMMDPRRGPSHRDLWQYKQLIDERSPVPVL